MDKLSVMLTPASKVWLQKTQHGANVIFEMAPFVYVQNMFHGWQEDFTEDRATQ